MENDVLKTIHERRSTRAFLPQAVDPGDLKQIVAAGGCAPYAQAGSRHFTVIQNKGILHTLNETAKETSLHTGIDHLAALGSDPDFHSIYHAPALVVISGNDGTAAPEADCAAAAQNILIAAQSLGVCSCWIFFVLLAFASPQGGALKAQLQVPEGYTPYVSVALGYSDQQPKGQGRGEMENITYLK